MAATEKVNIHVVQKAGNEHDRIVIGKIAASQGILMPNTPMYRSTAGTWKAAVTSTGTNDAIHGLLVGVVNPPNITAWPLAAELAANTEIRVETITSNDILEVYVENNGSDTAAVQAMVGDQYGITVSATAGQVGYTTVDINNSNATVKVEDIIPNLEPLRNTTSTSPGRLRVKVLQSVIDATKA